MTETERVRIQGAIFTLSVMVIFFILGCVVANTINHAHDPKGPVWTVEPCSAWAGEAKPVFATKYVVPDECTYKSADGSTRLDYALNGTIDDSIKLVPSK